MSSQTPVKNVLDVLVPISESKHLLANKLYQVAF